MKTKLPKLIEVYIQASNDADKETFLSCFSKDATVLDEGKILTGHEEIALWFTKTRKKYQFKSEPLSLEENGDTLILTSKVSGNFPGSPVNLSYQFKINSGLICDLRIM